MNRPRLRCMIRGHHFFPAGLRCSHCWRIRRGYTTERQFDLLHAYAAVAVRDLTAEFNAADDDVNSETYNAGEAFWWVTREGLRGCWGMGSTLEEATSDLLAAIEGWCEIGLSLGHNDIPVIEGIDLYDLSMSATPTVTSFSGWERAS